MDEKNLQLQVGIFVLLAIVILLALVYLNSEIWKGQYMVYIKPQTAPGVKINTPVRKNGILIGRVKSVRTGDEDVVIALRIDNDEIIYENELATIGAESILGDAVIEIVPTTPDARGNPIGPDGLINTVSIRRNPMEIVDVALNLESQISDTLQSIKTTASTFEDTAKRIGDAGVG
ncbi:MAG: MlaD family protein, partial [Planctomycetota bacterium]